MQFQPLFYNTGFNIARIFPYKIRAISQWCTIHWHAPAPAILLQITICDTFGWQGCRLYTRKAGRQRLKLVKFREKVKSTSFCRNLSIFGGDGGSRPTLPLTAFRGSVFILSLWRLVCHPKRLALLGSPPNAISTMKKSTLSGALFMVEMAGVGPLCLWPRSAAAFLSLVVEIGLSS